MDERIKTQLGVIREEVHVLLSGLPASDETTRQRLERIGDTAHEAWRIVGGGKAQGTALGPGVGLGAGIGDGLADTAAVQSQLDRSKDQAQGQKVGE